MPVDRHRSRAMGWGGVLLATVLPVSGCTTHVPPPVPGGIWDSSRHGTVGSATQGDVVWRLAATTYPGGSWGGEGTYGYHLFQEDPGTRRVVSVIDLGERSNKRVGNPVLGFGAVWMGRTKGDVIRVDTTTKAMKTITLENPGWWRGNEHIPNLAVGEGAVWVVIWGVMKLFRVDSETEQVEQLILPDKLGTPTSVYIDPGAVVVLHGKGVSRVDPRTRTVIATETK